MKKVLVSLPFIILLLLTIQSITARSDYILGTLGIVKFEFIDPSYELFFAICTYIGPLILVAYGYTRLASRSGINFNLLTYWVLIIFCGLFGFLGLVSYYYLTSNNLPTSLRLETPLILLVFAGIGVLGLIKHKIQKSSTENSENQTLQQDEE